MKRLCNADGKRILQLAVPAIVSNITVPLLNLVDLTIVGHLGSAVYIGAIAIGGLIFNIIYWLFSFLRMGTSGLTSQALGQRNLSEVMRVLLRSLGTAFVVAPLLIGLQSVILYVSFRWMDATATVQEQATVFFEILIWGAPATLGLYAFTGWYIGMQNSRFPMVIAIAQNVVNILLALLFVYVLKMNMKGVAWATLIAQYVGLFMAVGLWGKYYFRLRKWIEWNGVWNAKGMFSFFVINRDVFLRTLCLIAVTMYFTATGTRQGEIMLAVNTLLLQFFILFSYFMDGFAYAGEALVGRLLGACNISALRRIVYSLFVFGGVLAGIFSLLYWAGGNVFVRLITSDVTVVSASKPFMLWVYIIPLVSFAAFLWDGIFIGATAMRQMLISIAVATLAFFCIVQVGVPVMGNHALWLAFVVYLAIRGLMQTLLHRRIYVVR